MRQVELYGCGAGASDAVGEPQVGGPTSRHLDPDATNETEIARVLDELLTRAQAGPLDLASAKVVARTRVGAATHRPPREDPIDKATDGDPNHSETGKTGSGNAGSGNAGSGNDSHPLAAVIPLGVFDADAEAERWP